jgi:tight adherence protein B
LEWLVLPPAWVFISRIGFGLISCNRRSALFTQFPDALFMIVRAVRVGLPRSQAMRAVVREAPEPTRSEFSRLVERLSIGTAFDAAMLEMAQRTGLPEYRFFATALALQSQTGGSLSDTLEGLADVIRKRVALKERGKALSSEARASAMVLVVLPFAISGILWILNPAYIGVLFTQPAGNKLLAAAVLSLGLGLLSMRFIINRSLR